MKKAIALLLLAVAALACDKELYTPIPYAPVSMKIYLDGSHSDLNTNTAYMLFPNNNSSSNTGANKLGYGGLLIISSPDSHLNNVTLYAYDLACPFEVRRDIRVNPVNESGSGRVPTALTAVCPKCGSEFNLINGKGEPMKGSTAKYGLKVYNVSKLSNQRYYVSQ